ncbi:MAG: SRPBCC family protein [Hylemonella sp.]
MTPLETEAAALAAREILSTRHFAQSREQLWAAFSEPQRLARWWGPAGFRNTFDVFEFRPGGAWRFTMHGPDGKDYPNRSVFHSVEAPARIVLEHENAPHFELQVTLSEEAGGTRLHWRMRFDDAITREALAGLVVPANEQNFDRLQAELDRNT